MKHIFIAGLIIAFMVDSGSCFGFMGGMLMNPAAMLNAARYMTQIVMRNMAQKRTKSMSCVDHVSRSAVSFFNEASVSLQLGRLLQLTQRRSSGPGSAAVPLRQFCRLVNVRRLRAASDTFVSRLACLEGAEDDTDRLFRSLVYTIEHVCRDGGRASQQFLDDARQCRKLDEKHEDQLSQVRQLHRSRRSATAGPLTRPRTAGTSSPLLTTPSPPTTANNGSHHTTTAAAAITTRTTARTTAATPRRYNSLQKCLDDVNGLLPKGAQLSPQEQLTDFLLTLPALLPRLLQKDGLTQFCPALLKGADCAHHSLRQCSAQTQRQMQRFFQAVIRDILCDGIPSDEELKSLIWYPEVMKNYYQL